MPTSTFPFLLLPQELRDQIYQHHLSATYNHYQPQSFIHRTSPSISQIPHHETPQQRQYGRLALLQVSKSVHEEAKLVFYKRGIFQFNVPHAITSLRHSLLDPATLSNIIIDLDFDAIFSAPHYCENETADLIKHFARSKTTLTRSSCVVKIRAIWKEHLLLRWDGVAKAIRDAIGGLTEFKTVVVKLPYLFWEQEKMWGYVAPFYEQLGTYLEGGLGKKEEGYDDEMWFCLRYCPQDR